jgi:transcriptional regulator with XRE-family HTH domain
MQRSDHLNIGTKIKFFRHKHDISLEQLSQATGIDQTTLESFESSEKIPKSEYMDKISRALEVEIPSWFSDI